ncbi:MAG: hypothetical protein U0326_32945 [Polyangiales bacterium]
MPSNQKKFYKVQQKDFARLQSQGRAKGWIFGPGNLIRNDAGLVVRLNYDVSVEQLSVEVRQAAKESTPAAFIDAFWDTLQRVSENASTSP